MHALDERSLSPSPLRGARTFHLTVDFAHSFKISKRSGGPRVGLPKWGCVYIKIIMYYVYILQSAKDKTYYIGVTTDLKNRFKEHNAGESKFSRTKIPYNLIWYGAFINKETAYAFEKYLKSSSGFAFRNKHFI